MLPYSLACSFTSIAGGFLVSKTGSYRPTIAASFAVFALGMGLMYQLDSFSSIAEQVVYPLIASLGLGALFELPLIALQAAMPIKDMATSTSAYGFIRYVTHTRHFYEQYSW
jgi:hypothetical protein